MKRETRPLACQVQELDVTDFAAAPLAWFQEQPDVGGVACFLAHADDGVIWGQILDGQLLTSDNMFPQVSPPLRAITLQQARLFGSAAEVRVWRVRNGFKACRLQDQRDEKAEAFDEAHILWGTRVEDQKQGFTLVADGRQGLRHALPLPAADIFFDPPEKKRKRWHSLRLGARHYLEYDESGMVVIVQSRLTKLWAEKREEDTDE